MLFEMVFPLGAEDMRRCAGSLIALLLLAGCARDDMGTVQPAPLSPDEERQIMEQMNQLKEPAVPGEPEATP
jgi:hypothetical protein